MVLPLLPSPLCYKSSLFAYTGLEPKLARKRKRIRLKQPLLWCIPPTQDHGSQEKTFQAHHFATILPWSPGMYRAGHLSGTGKAPANAAKILTWLIQMAGLKRARDQLDIWNWDFPSPSLHVTVPSAETLAIFQEYQYLQIGQL